MTFWCDRTPAERDQLAEKIGENWPTYLKVRNANPQAIKLERFWPEWVIRATLVIGIVAAYVAFMVVHPRSAGWAFRKLKAEYRGR